MRILIEFRMISKTVWYMNDQNKKELKSFINCLKRPIIKKVNESKQ